MEKKQVRVLVVEDEPAHAEMIRRNIDRSGSMLMELVTSLESCRGAIAGDLPDILLVDLNLPDGDALELLADNRFDCPVLIMTSQGSEARAVEALKAGAQDYLVKSAATFEQMPRIIEQSLREWRITRERQEAIDELRKSEVQLRKLSLAVEQSPAAVVITDLNAEIEYVNPKFTEITGYSSSDVLGENPRILHSGLVTAELYQQLWSHLQAGKEWQGEFINKHKAGHLFWERAKISPLRDEQGRITHYVAVKEDITVQKDYEKQLEFLATHDELTGLANRTLLKDRFNQAVGRAQRSKYKVAVILLDLDRFKLVNDSLGHGKGDELLCLVAQRLKESVRETDTVARFGGDEFVVLLEAVAGVDNAWKIAKKILHRLSQPYLLADRTISVTASLGLSLAPDDGADAITLIRNADIAMYHAKRRRGAISFYNEEMNRQLIAVVELEEGLRQALAGHEFLLHYQPKVDLRSGCIKGCEALLRWQHPQRGLVAPGEFISLAEETGLIVPIGTWAIQEACRQSLAWQAAGLPPTRIAVNLSARQFLQGDLNKVVGTILQESKLAPELLELEVTESMIMDNPLGAVQTLRELKKLGVYLSLDDFGTGYSSLNYLRRFPVDSLKIDQSFIRDVTDDASGASVVASIIDIAHNLNLTAIAEGVETQAQLDFLLYNDCDTVQGYLFSKPLPAAEFAQLLREGTSLKDVLGKG